MAKYDWNTFRNCVAFLAGGVAPGTRRPHHDSELISCYHDAFLTWGRYHNNIVLFYHNSPVTRSHFMDPTDRAIKGFYCITLSVCITIHLCFSLRRPFVHGLFVSWGATGWRFVINSPTNVHVTIDCSTVLPLVLGVVIRQKLLINGSVVLGADESPWPCGTPSWYTPFSWMILSKQKNLHPFSSQYICVFP